MRYTFIRALFGAILCNVVAVLGAATSNIRAIYLFKDVMKSDTASLTTAGFNSVIIFGVGVLEDGDIMYYSNTPGSSDVVVASNGTYVGGAALADKVLSLKSGGVERVEISMNAQHVRELMMMSSGPSSRIYRNFAALRAAWGLDAVNNDDESLYDVASTVAFARMLGDIGYRYTIAPYANAGFWASVVEGVNEGRGAEEEPDRLLDRAYLQCYDGGAYNSPGGWQSALGMRVVPLVWVTNDSKPSYGTTPAQARSKFSGWSAQSGGLAGGGYWNDYDIEKMGLSYTEYGDVLTTVFP
ncbi:hypothetical protein F4778DRAFT_278651 [Xylariomycetidae sp. FL2044]|nr:hypothetical protein F4778DRAFT_278651 [Xylariomycetidae sp. FL2044]